MSLHGHPATDLMANLDEFGGVASSSGQHAHNTTGVTVHRQPPLCSVRIVGIGWIRIRRTHVAHLMLYLSLLGDEAVVFSHTTLCMMSVCMCVVFPHSTFSPV